MFDSLHIANSGLGVYRTWLDAVSDNIANLNTVRPTDENAFQARFVVVEAAEAGGARVSGIDYGNAEGRMAYQPDHPLADATGYVRLPDIDMGDQMTQMMMAQRGYQANLAVVDRARDAYLQALQLGKG